MKFIRHGHPLKLMKLQVQLVLLPRFAHKWATSMVSLPGKVQQLKCNCILYLNIHVLLPLYDLIYSLYIIFYKVENNEDSY